MKADIGLAGRILFEWAVDQVRLRNIVRRPYAVIDGKVTTDVVYHRPEDMK